MCEDTAGIVPVATTNSASPATTILAIDLGKFRSVACGFDPLSGQHRFQTIATTPAAVHDLLVEMSPAKLVIEACSVSGWVSDLAAALGVAVQVANTNGEAWKWKRVKRKTDRDDALKLAKLCATDQLPLVHAPKLDVRQHRALIKYRHGLIDRRTGVKNTIRSLLDAQGLSLPGRSAGWTRESIAELHKLSKPKQYQSGQMNRLGRITGQGPGLLRRVLVQVAWGLQRREGTRGRAVFERLCHGQRTRRKQAAVALARKILVWCWALLRDGSVWDDTRNTTPQLT